MDEVRRDYERSDDQALLEQPLSEAEIAGVREALSQADAGQLIPFEDVVAWLDSLDTDKPLPMPEPRHAEAKRHWRGILG
jgi:predicted transcriptional regulator